MTTLAEFSATVGLSEPRDTLCVFENDPGAICCRGTGRFAVVHDPRVRPEGYARAAAATFIVTHDIPPFGPVNVTMTIDSGHHTLVDKSIMPDTQDVPYLMPH